MGVDFIYPEFEVVRNESRCIACRVCERQCANEVHSFSPERDAMISDETKCVDCPARSPAPRRVGPICFRPLAP